MSVQDLFNLKGKVAIVTGGGRGLGEQIARALAEAGASVVVCSRKLEACEEVSKELKQFGVDSLAIACDVTNETEIDNVITKTVEHFGTIDILVNNSGTAWGAHHLEMPADKWQRVMDVNLTATFLMSQAAAKVMVENRSGKIINIASITAFGGQDPRIQEAIGYTTSKGAVVAFTKDLAVKLAPYNVHVNAIAPGFFKTKMTDFTIGEAGDLILAQTPLDRLGSEEDLKGAAIFLASKASDFVVGHVLTVDGGVLARII